jgi:ATP-binding cassette subfamily B protein
MLGSGLAEIFSLAAVLPFLTVLSEPELLWQNSFLRQLALDIGIQKPSGLVLPTTAFFAAAAVFAAAMRLANLWLNGRLAACIGSDLSCETYLRTLYQPYSIHIQRNSSNVINTATTQIAQTVAAINIALQMATSAVVAVSIVGALLLVNWRMTLTATAIFGSAYGILAGTTRRKLAANSSMMAETSQQQLKALQEGLGAIRDVLLDSSQSTYFEIYQKADLPLRLRQAESGYLGAFPRYALEGLGMVLIALIALLFSWRLGSSVAILPLLGTLALGAQRILPALQQVYGGWAFICSYKSALADVLDMLDQPIPEKTVGAPRRPAKLNLKSNIELKDISFGYSKDRPLILSNINLVINRGECIGIVGKSGSGKSTLLDLITGLLSPTEGVIMVDGRNIHESKHPELLASWRSIIGYVPQNIYLTDSSIAENIAFGIRREEIDMAKVRQAAAQAQIAAFIESSQDGYNSFAGERGIRLSGGQRQRIGIARALYKDAQVLVFDEATSALDTQTESLLMQSVKNLSGNFTTIIIAHRLKTVSQCDRIIEVSHRVTSEKSMKPKIIER